MSSQPVDFSIDPFDANMDVESDVTTAGSPQKTGPPPDAHPVNVSIDSYFANMDVESDVTTLGSPQAAGPPGECNTMTIYDPDSLNENYENYETVEVDSQTYYENMGYFHRTDQLDSHTPQTQTGLQDKILSIEEYAQLSPLPFHELGGLTSARRVVRLPAETAAAIAKMLEPLGLMLSDSLHVTEAAECIARKRSPLDYPTRFAALTGSEPVPIGYQEVLKHSSALTGSEPVPIGYQEVLKHSSALGGSEPVPIGYQEVLKPSSALGESEPVLIGYQEPSSTGDQSEKDAKNIPKRHSNKPERKKTVTWEATSTAAAKVSKANKRKDYVPMKSKSASSAKVSKANKLKDYVPMKAKSAAAAKVSKANKLKGYMPMKSSVWELLVTKSNIVEKTDEKMNEGSPVVTTAATQPVAIKEVTAFTAERLAEIVNKCRQSIKTTNDLKASLKAKQSEMNTKILINLDGDEIISTRAELDSKSQPIHKRKKSCEQAKTTFLMVPKAAGKPKRGRKVEDNVEIKSTNEDVVSKRPVTNKKQPRKQAKQVIPIVYAKTKRGGNTKKKSKSTNENVVPKNLVIELRMKPDKQAMKASSTAKAVWKFANKIGIKFTHDEVISTNQAYAQTATPAEIESRRNSMYLRFSDRRSDITAAASSVCRQEGFLIGNVPKKCPPTSVASVGVEHLGNDTKKFDNGPKKSLLKQNSSAEVQNVVSDAKKRDNGPNKSLLKTVAPAEVQHKGNDIKKLDNGPKKSLIKQNYSAEVQNVGSDAKNLDNGSKKSLPKTVAPDEVQHLSNDAKKLDNGSKKSLPKQKSPVDVQHATKLDKAPKKSLPAKIAPAKVPQVGHDATKLAPPRRRGRPSIDPSLRKKKTKPKKTLVCGFCGQDEDYIALMLRHLAVEHPAMYEVIRRDGSQNVLEHDMQWTTPPTWEAARAKENLDDSPGENNGKGKTLPDIGGAVGSETDDA